MAEKKHKDALDETAEHSIPLTRLPFDVELRLERRTYSLPTVPTKKEETANKEDKKSNQS